MHMQKQISYFAIQVFQTVGEISVDKPTT